MDARDNISRLNEIMVKKYETVEETIARLKKTVGIVLGVMTSLGALSLILKVSITFSGIALFIMMIDEPLALIAITSLVSLSYYSKKKKNEDNINGLVYYFNNK